MTINFISQQLILFLSLSHFRRSQIGSYFSVHGRECIQDEGFTVVAGVLRTQPTVENNGDATIEPDTGEAASEVTWIFPTVQRGERIHIVELLRCC